MASFFDGTQLMAGGQSLRITARAGARTIALQLASTIPDLNLGAFEELLVLVCDELEKRRSAKRHGTWIYPSLGETRRIYESAKIQLQGKFREIDSPTELYEIKISYGAVVAALAKSSRTGIQAKIDALAGHINHRFVVRLARDLAWVVQAQERIVGFVVKEQSDYLRSGVKDHLHPISMVNIGEALGLHPSTVSRLLKQVNIGVGGREFPISLLVPANRLDSIRIRTTIQEMAADRRYSDGTYWLLTAEDMRNVLQRRLGIMLNRRSVSKYMQEANLLANHGRDLQRPSEGEVRAAWRLLFGEPRGWDDFSASERARIAAQELEEKRRTETETAVERVCSKLADNHWSLVYEFARAGEEIGLLVDAGKNSVLLRLEPWLPSLFELHPGSGLMINSDLISEEMDVDDQETFRSEISRIFPTIANVSGSRRQFVAWDLLSRETLNELVSSLPVGSLDY